MQENKITYTHKSQIVILAVFAILTLWWAYSFFVVQNYNNLAWGASYQIVAALGVIYGLIASVWWGGFKSILGRSALFFSLGLILQVFGQSAFSYYNLILQVNIPYPSVADIGYFGSIPMYIYATTLLLKVSGGKVALRSMGNKALAVALPVAMLVFSYLFFLRAYEFDWSQPLNIALDFGYPLGQAIYVSAALVTYILSRKYLGGMLKNSVLIILFALVAQYVADYNFLYQAYHGTWINGGYGDFLYLLSYCVLALGLIQLGQAFKKLRDPSNESI